MKSKQRAVAASLAQRLAAFNQPIEPPKARTIEKIFADKDESMSLCVRLGPKDLKALRRTLDAARAAGRGMLNMTQAIRASIRCAPFDLGVVDAVIGEDPRRRENRERRR